MSPADEPYYRAIALYLPQFHPTAENDAWWGKGFTEWTNVTKARPLYRGHRQPNLPSDLGYYDLRVPEVREAQAQLAREAGIEAFCYWHYWFGGRRILERPFNEVVASGQPDFPFCLAWANESWQGHWHGVERRTLIEQTYDGQDDVDAHFRCVLPALRDRRAVRVNGKPLFVVYQPTDLPRARQFIDRWQELARAEGLPGIYFVAHLIFLHAAFDWRAAGFDGALAVHALKVMRTRAWDVVREYRRRRGNGVAAKAAARLAVLRLAQRLLRWPGSIYHYQDAALFMNPPGLIRDGWYPTVIPNWDNSPRSGKKGIILHGCSPENYQAHLREMLSPLDERPRDQRLVFIKSWNEWAEGNYLEPDRQFGHGWLKVTRSELFRHR